MAAIMCEGFDLRDIADKPGWVSTSGTASTTTPFGVGSAWSMNSSATTGQSVVYRFTAVAQVFTGMACAINSANSPGMSFYGDTGATQHITIRVLSTGVINIERGAAGGTLLAASAVGAFPVDGTYRYLEATVIVSDTVGFVEVRVNGVVVVSFSGDTKNAGTNSTIDQVRYGWVGTGANGIVMLIDDLYLFDATGATHNTYYGPWARVQTLKPASAGASTQFTPLSGSNFSNVNDIPDNTATYNSDTVPGHRDTFTMDDLTSGTTDVAMVQQTMHARQLDGGTATIKQAQKSGATISYGATKTLIASNTGYTDKFETNPATGLAWTVAEVNALEAGYEVV